MGSLSSNTLLHGATEPLTMRLPRRCVPTLAVRLVTGTIATLCCLPVPLFPTPVSQQGMFP